MELLDKRIKEINQELIELSQFRESLESQLKAVDIQMAQKVGAVNELKSILESYIVMNKSE